MSVSLFCSCESGIPNLGQPGCIDGFSRDARFIIVNYRDDAGNINSIQAGDFVGDSLPTSFVDGKIQETDLSKRWYITEQFRIPTPERGEPITEDIDGVATIVRQGIKTYSATFVKPGNPQYAGRLNAICQDVGYFSIDVDGRIKGMFVDGELRPTRIEGDTMNAIFMEPTADAKQKTVLNFTVDLTENDGNLSFIEASSTDSDMLTVKGLIDVAASGLTGISTTEFTVDLKYCYGEAFNNIPFKGGVVGTFSLDETSPTPGNIPLDSVTESPDGTYLIDYSSTPQTPGDVLELTILTTSGFELTEPLVVTIP